MDKLVAYWHECPCIPADALGTEHRSIDSRTRSPCSHRRFDWVRVLASRLSPPSVARNSARNFHSLDPLCLVAEDDTGYELR